MTRRSYQRRVVPAIWIAALLACSDNPAAPAAPADPANASFVTSDVEHFWQAYDGGATNTTLQTR
jgi:hypothetical protein